MSKRVVFYMLAAYLVAIVLPPRDLIAKFRG